MSWFGFGGDKTLAEAVYEDFEDVEDESAATQLATKLLAEIAAHLSVEEFEPIVLAEKFGEIKMWEKKEASDLVSLNSEGHVSGVEPQAFLDAYWGDKTLESRKVWASDLLSFEIVETFGDRTDLVHQSFAAGAPLVSNREFVLLRTYEVETDGSINFVSMSVNRKSVRLAHNDNVRAFSYFAFRAAKDELGTLYRSSSRVDPKGWIPAALLNLFKTKPAERIQHWQQNLARITAERE